MNTIKYIFFTTTFLIFCTGALLAQESSENTVMPQRKNVIRYNITPSLLGFDSYIFGYERIIKPYQSFSINVGYLALGKNKEATSEEYNLVGTKNSNGFSVVADYRFYLNKENKFKAPRGVYIGPYFASYFLASDRKLRSNDASIGNPEINLDTKFNIQNLGVELGYQFVIKKRFTVDLVFAGPSLSRYRFQMNPTSDADLSDAEIDEAIETLRDILIDRYPWTENLFDFDGEGVDLRGNRSIWSFGFRYVLQVGYHF